MNKDVLKSGDTDFDKHTSYYSKYPLDITNVDFDKKMISNKVSFGKTGFKYFFGYKHFANVKSLCLMLSKRIEYAKSFDETICFSLKDDKFLEHSCKILGKVIKNIKKCLILSSV